MRVCVCVCVPVVMVLLSKLMTRSDPLFSARDFNRPRTTAPLLKHVAMEKHKKAHASLTDDEKKEVREDTEEWYLSYIAISTTEWKTAQCVAIGSQQ